jgi:hypothetical protein
MPSNTSSTSIPCSLISIACSPLEASSCSSAELERPHNAIRGAVQLMRGADRYWHFESMWQVCVGLRRAVKWDLGVRAAASPRFLLIAPRMRDGKIDFKNSDDDAVHLCHPVSFRKWFRARGSDVLQLNRFGTKWRAQWNALCPTLATSNELVFGKQ